MDFNRPPDEMLIQAHVEQRAEERYGVPLSEHDASDMESQIRENRGVFVRRHTGKVKIWLVWWAAAKRIVPVYYSTSKGKVLSVLPENQLRYDATSLRGSE